MKLRNSIKKFSKNEANYCRHSNRINRGDGNCIERSTPLLNDDTGSFSFPFPVPTLPNQRVLGWPGNLERTGDIPDQTFVLEDSGLQILLGEVDYDEITKDEIGVILKSGFTEFTKRMEGKKLGDIEYGGETWPINTPQVPWTTEALTPLTNGINNKILEWAVIILFSFMRVKYFPLFETASKYRTD